MDVVLAEIPTAFTGNSSAWLLMGMAVMAVIYLTVRPKKKDPLASQPFRLSLTQQKALERDMQNVIVELSEMTRQMSAQLESRAAKLELLIHDADERLAQLDAARARHDGSPGEGAGDAHRIGSVASHDPHVLPAPPTLKPATLRLVNHAEDRWSQIYMMADNGASVAQVAQQLGRPEGEIELILALRRKNQPSTDTGYHPPSGPSIASAS